MAEGLELDVEEETDKIPRNGVKGQGVLRK